LEDEETRRIFAVRFCVALGPTGMDAECWFLVSFRVSRGDRRQSSGAILNRLQFRPAAETSMPPSPVDRPFVASPIFAHFVECLPAAAILNIPLPQCRIRSLLSQLRSGRSGLWKNRRKLFL